ncbi:MAG: AAA family ATPase, partial [Bacteroidetes bacterium]|nr:AAA family ATPase [Bacteroidota bacterium]
MTPQNQFGTLLQQGSINVFLVEPTIDIPYKHILKVVDSNQLELRNQLTNEAKILHKLEGQIGKRLLKEGFTDGKKSLWLKYLEGQNLSDLLKNRADFKINDFYHLALEICKELKKIHDLGITHGNISAENIIKTHKSGIEFVNFQLSLTQSTKYFQYSNFELIPDFLESMAPEQTGKVNWSVDRRTDLYSLGMIFFRILVGRPAFHFNDLNDYAFAHILEKPPQIHSLNREIPTPLSKVIEKLIEKFPENRYQSIEGLISDLKALKNIQPSKLESFEIGLNDFSDNLNITEELIAKHEVINNLSKFMLDSNQLNLKLALLTGPTGTGKNKVAYELASKIGQTNGIMLYGKFHGNGHNQPFSGFIDVIKMYLQHIQTRDSLKLEEWQRKVNQLLGPQIESLIHFVPDLRNLFNNQNLTIQIIDSENQILYLFAKLISSFSDPSRPVVLMLDDLQWADSNSIKLIEFILKLDDFPFLNILATQREEVVLNKEVENLISNFEHHSAIFKKFTLKNFDEQETCEFIAKSIMRPFNQVESLSKIIFEKTQGNPFYLMRFIQAIYEEKELYFHHEFREWMWNAEAIESRNITNNVVDFIIDRFGTLDSISTDIAVLAANYGRVFPENIFQWVYKNKYTALQIHESLENLLELKIIVVSNHYPDLKCIDPYEELSFFEFKHDRLVEAALHKRGSAPNQHWEIGIALLENVTFESLRKSQQLYSVANHLNLGIKDKSISDYERLFQINLETGDEAKKAASFQLALDFYSKANEYASNIDISESERIDLNLKLAETKQFTGKSEEAETLYLSLFSNHADLETKALVGEKIIHFYTNNANYKKAYEFGCRLLSEFGIKFHLKPSKPRLIFQVIKTRILLSKHNIPDLINLPIADDIYHKMVIKCIASMLKSAYQIAPELCVEGAAKMVQQCLKKGNSPDSPVGYFVFGGIFIGGIMGDHQKGFEFGEM